MNDIGISTKEAGSILGVHESSIKRWCDSDALAFTLTPGGHRRVSLDAVIDLGRARNIRSHLLSLGTDASVSWAQVEAVERSGNLGSLVPLVRRWLDDNDVDRCFHFFRLLLERRFSLAALLDDVLTPVMRQVGEEWASGALRIADEHRITALVLSLLHRIAYEQDANEEQRSPENHSGIAVVACLPEVYHELGAFMAHVVLKTEGWKVHYLGRGLPVEDISDFQVATGADLVCLSVAPPRGMPEIRQAAVLLSRLYKLESPYRLAFGGAGVAFADEFVGTPFESVKQFGSMRRFSEWLSEPKTK